jgi:hypothetical protein
MQQRQAKLRDEINEYGRLYTATADEPGSSGGKMLDSIIQALPSRLNLMSSSSAAAPVKSLGRRAVDSCRPLDLPTQHEIYTYILEPLGRHQQQKASLRKSG